MAELEADEQKLQFHDDSLQQQQQQQKLLLSPYRADQPLIVFDGHPHPLVFLENLPDDGEVGSLKCSTCDKRLSESSPHHQSSIFHCPACGDFNLHLLCGPLPCSLKQESHYETLELKDSHIPNWLDDEFYCDSCEESRDPRECVYYGERCYYSAEIKCVMPELRSALTGKCGDVALRTLGKWHHTGMVASRGMSIEHIQQHRTRIINRQKPGISLGYIKKSLTKREKKRLDNILKSKDKLLEEFNREAHHELFVHLVGMFDSLELNLLRKSWHKKISFVRVGDYLVPYKLVDIYEDLYQKYGDISDESNLSRRLKAFFFLYLCLTVERMWATRVVDATKDEICSWWISLRAVRAAGFRIQFAVDALTRVMYSYFELQRLQLVDKVESKITCGEDDVRDMKASLKETEEKLRKFKDDLKSGECSIAQECLKEVAAVLYETAYEVILGDDFKHISRHNLGIQDNFAHVGNHRHSVPLIPQEDPAGKDWHCSICGGSFSDTDTIYKCSDSSDCNLMVDGHCSSAIKAMVEFVGHEHQIFFLNELSRRHPAECSMCEEQISLDSMVFKCGDCDDIYHLQCGPLPCELKLHLNGYDMTLTLRDSLVLVDDPEDSWCDICEEQRDPGKPVYHSPHPPFIATIECVMPQIKLVLEGSLEHVKLRMAGRGIIPSGRVISRDGEKDDVQPENAEEENQVVSSNSDNVQTEDMIAGTAGASTSREDNDDVIATWTLEEMLQSLSEHERDLIRYAAAKEEWSKYRQAVEEKTEEDAVGVAAGVIDEYSDAAFRCFKEKLENNTGRYLYLLFEEWQARTHYQELRRGFIMPSIMAELHMQQIFYINCAYTFVDNAELTQRVKALVVILHTIALGDMQLTPVFEITEDILGAWRTIFSWTSHLTIYSKSPIPDNLNKKLVRICFGNKVRKFEADLLDKLQQLPREIEQKEAELGAFKARLQQYKGIPLEKSTTWKQYQEEARISKWKKAGELIPSL